MWNRLGYDKILENMKKVFLLVLIVVVALLMLGISENKASIADTSIPNDEVPSSVGGIEDSSSESAIITITMRTAPLPDE